MCHQMSYNNTCDRSSPLACQSQVCGEVFIVFFPEKACGMSFMKMTAPSESNSVGQSAHFHRPRRHPVFLRISLCASERAQHSELRDRVRSSAENSPSLLPCAQPVRPPICLRLSVRRHTASGAEPVGSHNVLTI